MIFYGSIFSDCWSFVARHPGLILVLIGVIGEGVEIIPKIWFEKFYEKFKRKLEITGAVCWGILVIGLAIELSEAAELDSDVASSNERSKQLESTNLVLRAEVLKQERRTRARFVGFDSAACREALKDKPTMKLEILYQQDDVESYDLASSVMMGIPNGGWYPLFMRAALESDSIEPNVGGRPLILRAGGASWGGIGYVVSFQLLSEMQDSKTGTLNTNNAAGALLHAMNMAQRNDSLAVHGFHISAPSNFPTNLIRIVIAKHYLGPN